MIRSNRIAHTTDASTDRFQTHAHEVLAQSLVATSPINSCITRDFSSCPADLMLPDTWGEVGFGVSGWWGR